MSGPRAAVLYSPALLQLAVDLARYPFNISAIAIGSARSRTCGSTVELSSRSGDAIDEPGLKVAACAVGQAAAAIFAAHAQGRTLGDCERALDDIVGWLGGSGGLPNWPGIAALEAARDYPGRHEAIQLPWRAAIDALCKATGGR